MVRNIQSSEIITLVLGGGGLERAGDFLAVFVDGLGENCLGVFVETAELHKLGFFPSSDDFADDGVGSLL